MNHDEKKETDEDMFAMPIDRAIIIRDNKEKDFLKLLKESIPTKEFWDECKKSTASIDAERLEEIYRSNM